jgi:hypothetical protein
MRILELTRLDKMQVQLLRINMLKSLKTMTCIAFKQTFIDFAT